MRRCMWIAALAFAIPMAAYAQPQDDQQQPGGETSPAPQVSVEIRNGFLIEGVNIYVNGSLCDRIPGLQAHVIPVVPGADVFAKPDISQGCSFTPSQGGTWEISPVGFFESVARFKG